MTDFSHYTRALASRWSGMGTYRVTAVESRDGAFTGYAGAITFSSDSAHGFNLRTLTWGDPEQQTPEVGDIVCGELGPSEVLTKWFVCSPAFERLLYFVSEGWTPATPEDIDQWVASLTNDDCDPDHRFDHLLVAACFLRIDGYLDYFIDAFVVANGGQLARLPEHMGTWVHEWSVLVQDGSFFGSFLAQTCNITPSFHPAADDTCGACLKEGGNAYTEVAADLLAMDDFTRYCETTRDNT